MALTNPSVISRPVATGGPGGGNDDRFIIQMEDKIWDYGAHLNPLTQMSRKIKKRSVGNPTFKIMNDKQLPRFDALNGAVNGSVTTFTVDNGSYFRVGDDVLVTSTGEHVLVTAISTNDLTVVRGYDSVAAGTGTAALDNAELRIVGNTLSERAASPSILVTDPATVTNYVQRFGRSIGVSLQRKNTDEYGTDEKERQKKSAMFEFKKDVESAFIYGTPLFDEEGNSPLDSAVTDTRYKTGGILYWIDNFASSNILDAGGALSQNALWDFVEPLYKYMPEDTTNQQMELMALCSAKAFKVFHSWGIPAVEISERTKEFGLQLRTYLTPVGRLTLVQHYLLDGTEYQDYMVVINPDDLEYVYQQNLDVQLKLNTQNNDVPEEKDEVMGFIGFGIKRPELHGYVKNMQLAA